MASVTRRTKSPRADRRAEIRRRLLDVVESLLGQGESYADISVERLVSEAGLSRSTFYVYFEDKGDLLRAWFAEVTEELEKVAQRWWTLDTGLSRVDVRDALAGIVITYRPHTTLMSALYDAAAYDPAVRELVSQMMGSNIGGLRKHIRAGQNAGFIDPELAPEQTASWLMWMSERGLHQLVRDASPAELDRLIDSYTSIVWNTLYRYA